MLDGPVETPGPVGRLADGDSEGPGLPADRDEALSDKISEDVEAVMEEEEVEPDRSSVDEPGGPSLTPLDAELVGRLEIALFDAELGGSVVGTLRLPVPLGLGTPRDSDGVETPGDEADTVPPLEVGKPEVSVPEVELPDAVIDASVLCLVLRLG